MREECLNNTSSWTEENDVLTKSKRKVKRKKGSRRARPYEETNQQGSVKRPSLIVNLEDLVKEEEMIFKVMEAVSQKKYNVAAYCQRWWRLTQSSSVVEMEAFFEEDSAKELIRK